MDSGNGSGSGSGKKYPSKKKYPTKKYPTKKYGKKGGNGSGNGSGGDDSEVSTPTREPPCAVCDQTPIDVGVSFWCVPAIGIPRNQSPQAWRTCSCSSAQARHIGLCCCLTAAHTVRL